MAEQQASTYGGGAAQIWLLRKQKQSDWYAEGIIQKLLLYLMQCNIIVSYAHICCMTSKMTQ